MKWSQRSSVREDSRLRKRLQSYEYPVATGFGARWRPPRRRVGREKVLAGSVLSSALLSDSSEIAQDPKSARSKAAIVKLAKAV